MTRDALGVPSDAPAGRSVCRHDEGGSRLSEGGSRHNESGCRSHERGLSVRRQRLSECRGGLSARRGRLSALRERPSAHRGRLSALRERLSAHRERLSERRATTFEVPRASLAVPREAQVEFREALGTSRESLGMPREALGRPREALGRPREALGVRRAHLVGIIEARGDAAPQSMFGEALSEWRERLSSSRTNSASSSSFLIANGPPARDRLTSSRTTGRSLSKNAITSARSSSSGCCARRRRGMLTRPHGDPAPSGWAPSELRPRRIPLPWSGQRDLNPQPLGFGPSALARLSYTQVSSARWESNPDRTRIRRPGLTETTRRTAAKRRRRRCAGGPSANRTQCRLLIREPRVTNPSWPVGANERIRTSTARGLSPPPPASWATLAQRRTEGFEPSLARV